MQIFKVKVVTKSQADSQLQVKTKSKKTESKTKIDTATKKLKLSQLFTNIVIDFKQCKLLIETLKTNFITKTF